MILHCIGWHQAAKREVAVNCQLKLRMIWSDLIVSFCLEYQCLIRSWGRKYSYDDSINQNIQAFSCSKRTTNKHHIYMYVYVIYSIQIGNWRLCIRREVSIFLLELTFSYKSRLSQLTIAGVMNDISTASYFKPNFGHERGSNVSQINYDMEI